MAAATVHIGGIDLELSRKAIRTLRVAVYPPDGRVKVSVPFGTPDSHIEEFIESRMGWIQKQQNRFRNQRREMPHSYIDGEMLLLRGREMPLRLLSPAPGHRRGRADYNPQTGAIELHCGSGLDEAGRENLIYDFYRRSLEEDTARIWPGFAARLGVEPAGFTYRRMKSRWGSCNTRTRHINLNIELEKRPPACLELVVAHELAHLVEAGHNARFRAAVALILPDWKTRERLLKSWPL